MMPLNGVSPKTEMRVTGVYSDLQSLQKDTFTSVISVILTTALPARYPFVAEESEAPEG